MVALVAALVVALTAGAIGTGIGMSIAHRRNSSAPAADSTALTPNSTAPPVSQSAPSIVAKVGPGVVDITSALGYQNATSAGTGMVVSSSGEVITNNHVISGATKITVQIDGQGPTYSASVLGTDPTEDVALLQIEGVSGLKTVKLGDSSKVAVGDPVIAIGNALNLKGPPSVTDGSITALNQSITAGDPTGLTENLSGLIEISAPLRPGDSGGPLVNGAAEVVGMDTAASGGRRRAGSSIGFAIPINQAKSIADQIRAGHASATIHLGTRAFLGIEMQPTSSGSGAVLSGVPANTPAKAAGLAGGDTIVSFDGKPVKTPAELTQLIGAHHPGDRVQIGWVDTSGRRHTATVKLIAGPAD